MVSPNKVQILALDPVNIFLCVLMFAETKIAQNPELIVGHHLGIDRIQQRIIVLTDLFCRDLPTTSRIDGGLGPLFFAEEWTITILDNIAVPKM